MIEPDSQFGVTVTLLLFSVFLIVNVYTTGGSGTSAGTRMLRLILRDRPLYMDVLERVEANLIITYNVDAI